ncbi:MAG: proline--tRNA ligase [Sphingomonadales bacterium]|nr:proline--tRNA ligase [Sphingomonadales bacterium]
MRLSRYFLPTLKEDPAEAEVVSHRLMLRAGLIRQSAAGIYSWLPFGYRALRNIEQIVREEQDLAGAQEMLMPTLQPAELWRESGRYEDYGKELLRIEDRRDRDLLYGPTNEELITDIFRHTVRSHKDLPKMLYHIQWKFRDEMRPRFGVVRGREFLMKDNYSFDLDRAGARRSYNAMFIAYLRTFARMGLKSIPMQADSGPIGGDMSHEFIILAQTGESEVFYQRELEDLDILGETVDYAADLQPLVDRWTGYYAATDEKHDPEACPVPAAELRSGRGIEVGHIFYFGTKYTKSMKAAVQGPDGEAMFPEMGSYGIGISRLVAAIIEACHDEAGIIWPDSVAPYQVGLINLRVDDGECTAAADKLYAALTVAGVSVLYDDRDERAGAKFSTMDLIGLPWQVAVGPRGLKAGVVEVKNRATGAREELAPEAALAKFGG